MSRPSFANLLSRAMKYKEFQLGRLDGLWSCYLIAGIRAIDTTPYKALAAALAEAERKEKR